MDSTSAIGPAEIFAADGKTAANCNALQKKLSPRQNQKGAGPEPKELPAARQASLGRLPILIAGSDCLLGKIRRRRWVSNASRQLLATRMPPEPGAPNFARFGASRDGTV
jgi:hypothetical protein